ncbi:MAG TPA: PilZ domain-containing protein [Deltaproteobacteria bacterium]|nr:PilZ domain-containing protein [Deltaproteobacteria bacterium]HQB38877.1 PilZ domain-containing protein [Deltaproteobacteria bacterium]
MNQRDPRFKKRLAVNFGTEEATRVAFTEDISGTGMFLRSANVCVPNTKLTITIRFEDNSTASLEARVMWAKKVPQNLFHLVRKTGMGVRIIRFQTGEQNYRSYCSQLADRTLPPA